jgi:reactive intermediate/imine deaminase
MNSRRNYSIVLLPLLYFMVLIILTECKNKNTNSDQLYDNRNNYNSSQSDAHNFSTSKTENMKTVEQIKITPDPYKPYNLAQGYKVDNILYISGQAAYGDNGELVGINDFDLQAEQTFKNLEKVLVAGGSSLKNIIKVTIFLKDMGNFNKIVALRKKYFKPPYPADTIVEISSLYSPNALIEIEAIAIVDAAIQQD